MIQLESVVLHKDIFCYNIGMNLMSTWCNYVKTQIFNFVMLAYVKIPSQTISDDKLLCHLPQCWLVGGCEDETLNVYEIMVSRYLRQEIIMITK